MGVSINSLERKGTEAKLREGSIGPSGDRLFKCAEMAHSPPDEVNMYSNDGAKVESLLLLMKPR